MTSTTSFMSLINKFANKTSHEKVMHLSIFVDSNDSVLKNMYVEAAAKHNKKIFEDPHFYDAGFDLYLPKNEKDSEYYGDGTKFFGQGWTDVTPTTKVDFQVKCCAKMYMNNLNKYYFTPFYTYARSSISKTPLRLANNQGIIDAGYRGSLIGMFDCIYTGSSDDREFDYYMEHYSRILQICAPGLVPIYVEIVDSVEELGPSTSRGEGGFGSTGV